LNNKNDSLEKIDCFTDLLHRLLCLSSHSVLRATALRKEAQAIPIKEFGDYKDRKNWLVVKTGGGD
jgi:hypothetical protein